MLVWVAGVETRPLTKALCHSIGKEQSDRRGLVVDGHQRVKGAKHVWAIGDCAFTGNPPTAQVASQEGKYLGRLFRDYDLDDAAAIDAAAPFSYHHAGTMAYVGGASAIAQLPNPLGKGSTSDHFFWRSIYSACENDHEHHTVNLAGGSAFGLWRSTYFSKLLSGKNRLSVALDWLSASFFGRDITAAALVELDYKPPPTSVSKYGVHGGEPVRRALSPLGWVRAGLKRTVLHA